MFTANLQPLLRRIRQHPGHCAKPLQITRVIAPTDRPEPEAYRLGIAKDGFTLQYFLKQIMAAVKDAGATRADASKFQ